VQLLADNKHLIDQVGEIRWREWGHPPEPQDRGWWVDITAKEAGHESLPITWVAVDDGGSAVGAVGLGEFDIEERRDRSPWVLGMIVRADLRGCGIGSMLMEQLHTWAAQTGFGEAWVATGGRAVLFYEACGWEQTETIERESGEMATVLRRSL
jgi:GNAT superfamily N-acetyltransferase